MSELQAPKLEPELEAKYKVRFETILNPLAVAVENQLKAYLVGVDRIDRVCARPKSVKKFIGKAGKLHEGSLKYREPLRQIQDQIGARIVTFYNTDVETVAPLVTQYYSKREFTSHVPESESEFGYEGKHFILNIPRDLYPATFDIDLMPDVFELQVKTLFQHAWAEAEHDLAYKPEVELDTNDKRLFEPLRVCRRPNSLRDWVHEQEAGTEVFA